MIVSALLLDKLVMISSLDYTSLFKNDDTVGVLNRTQSVSNDKCRPSLHELIHTLLYQRLRMGIDRACSFIKDKYRRICNSCTSDSKELSLTLRKVSSVSFKDRIIALRKVLNEQISISKFCSCINFLVGSIKLTVSDILLNRHAEQMCILQNDA